MPTNDVKSRNRILIIVAWIIAAAVLVTALVYFNFIEKDADKSHVLAVGDKVPDFSVSTYNGDGGDYVFSQTPENVEVTVINFWATWCGPCVMELPDFVKLQKKYSDKIKTVAIHGDYIDEDVTAFINKQGWEGVLFAQDETKQFTVKNNYGITESFEDTLYNLFGGTGPLPMTVIIDSDGVITFRRIGSIDYKSLEDAVLNALNN